MPKTTRYTAFALSLVLLAGCAEENPEPTGEQQSQALEQLAAPPSVDAARLVDLSAIHRTATTEEARAVIERCETGDTIACYELGDRLHGGDEVVRDNDLSIEFIDAACTAEYDRACYDMGVRYYMGAEVTQDMFQARRYFQTTCDMDYALGCHMLARMARQGLGGPADARLATRFEDRSCELGWVEDCGAEDAASIPQLGPNEARLGPDAAIDLVDAARRCDSGLMSGCTELGRAYRDGDGVEADAEMAFELFESACDWGELDACDVYRDMQASGM